METPKLNIPIDSGILRIADILFGRLSKIQSDRCLHYRYFTIRLLAFLGLVLLGAGMMVTRSARHAVHRLLDNLTGANGKGRTEGRSSGVPGFELHRKQELLRYNFVERRRLETAINGGISKVATARRIRRRFASGTAEVDDECDVAALRERLAAIRAERQQLKRRYGEHLDELTTNKRRLAAIKRNVDNTRTVVSVISEAKLDKYSVDAGTSLCGD